MKPDPIQLIREELSRMQTTERRYSKAIEELKLRLDETTLHRSALEDILAKLEDAAKGPQTPTMPAGPPFQGNPAGEISAYMAQRPEEKFTGGGL